MTLTSNSWSPTFIPLLSAILSTSTLATKTPSLYPFSIVIPSGSLVFSTLITRVSPMLGKGWGFLGLMGYGIPPWATTLLLGLCGGMKSWDELDPKGDGNIRSEIVCSSCMKTQF